MTKSKTGLEIILHAQRYLDSMVGWHPPMCDCRRFCAPLEDAQIILGRAEKQIRAEPTYTGDCHANTN